MKKLIIFILFVFTCNLLLSQDTANVRKHKNSIYLEFGFSNDGISLNFDKILYKSKFIALTASTGIASSFAEGFFSYPPISINLLIGKVRHYLLIGNNLLIEKYNLGVTYHYYYNCYLGYRFIPINKGLFLKFDIPINLIHYQKFKNSANSSYYEYFDNTSRNFDLSIGYTF